MGYYRSTCVYGYRRAITKEEAVPATQNVATKYNRGDPVDEPLVFTVTVVKYHSSFAAALRCADSMGIIQGGMMEHLSCDMSGNGRSSSDGLWKLNMETKKAEKVRGFQPVDDGADINGLWDELEGRYDYC